MPTGLNDKTVIRAGAGVFDQTLLGDIFYSLIGIHTSDYRVYYNSLGDNLRISFRTLIRVASAR